MQTISGDKITISEPAADTTAEEPEDTPLKTAMELLVLRKEVASLQQLKEVLEAAEKLQDTGTWCVNKTTGGVYYSNNLYRLHGVPAQSLNAHAHTFHSFIHPDDRPVAADALENAYKEELPLHMAYRIIKPAGEVRQMQLTTFWSFTPNGQRICNGILQDITGQEEAAFQMASLKGSLQLQERVLHFMEQQTGAGFWYTNLFTHKTDFSPHYLRIYGIRQQALPGYNAFLNLVHPEDRARVTEAVEKMYYEHTLPEMEFRIIRPDGKIRWLRQWGKLVIGSGTDMIMLGVV